VTPRSDVAGPDATASERVTLPQRVRVADLQRELGGDLDQELTESSIDAIAPLGSADATCLAPVFATPAHIPLPAGVLLVASELAAAVPAGRRWVHAHARWALSCLLDRAVAVVRTGISSRATVEDGVTIGANPSIGPNAVVFSGATIGADCSIGPNAVIYGCVRIGDRVVIGAGAVVGRPGFGWATGPTGEVRRVPQLGGVHIEDDVELGALVTVDAGTISPTRVRRGAKLDAHVHVGHNVDIGCGTMIAAQAGFAGSSRVGAGVLVGGQAGVADHVVIGDGARLAGKAGVIGNVAPGMVVAGYPAVERMRWLRSVATALRGRSK